MKSSQLLCAILGLGLSAFADEGPVPKQTNSQVPCPPQSEPLVCRCPAFNAPAVIDVRSKSYFPENLTAFIDGAFTYWYAGEEGLKVASTGVLSSGTSYFPIHDTSLYQSFDYKPGFKVEAGIVGSHSWTIYAQYSWFRGKNVTSGGVLSSTVDTAGVSTTTAASGTEVWLVDDWFLQGTSYGQALAGSNVASAWRLSLDILDALIGRPFYQGTHLVVSPFAGLRAAWIRQSMTVELTEASGLFGTTFTSGTEPHQPIGSRNHSNSWAIGPKFGMGASALLPAGFRFEGDAAASLLYTQYTSVTHSEDIASTSFNTGPYTASFKNYGVLRPMAELGLGVGWGSYLRAYDFHIDVSADYDFMIFWSQNMIRKLLDDTLTGTSPSSADLYVHGLTVTGRFDF